MDNKSNKFINLSWLVLAFGVLVLPGVSVAQQYYDPGVLQKTIDRKPIEYEAPGARVGSFVLHPGVEVAYENNDNIFYVTLDENKISDSIIHLRPWANLSSDWNRHALELRAFADLGFYNDFGSQDYEDWVTELNGRFDVRRGSHLDYRASYMQLHEDRGNPDAFLAIVEPTKFTLAGAGVGYTHAFNRLVANLRFDTSQTDYDDNVAITGEFIDNQDRNRSRDSAGLELDYGLSPQRSFFVGGSINGISYDQPIDNEGSARGSDGFDLRAGFRWDLTGVIVGDLYVNYVEQDYDDPAFNKIDGTGIGAGLDWTPTQLTNVHLRFANSVQETIQPDTSGYLSRLYSVRVQQDFRRNIVATARLSYTDNDYQYNGSDPEALQSTEVIRGDIGLAYIFNRNFYLSGGYSYENQDSNAVRFEYEINRWYLTLGTEL